MPNNQVEKQSKWGVQEWLGTTEIVGGGILLLAFLNLLFTGEGALAFSIAESYLKIGGSMAIAGDGAIRIISNGEESLVNWAADGIKSLLS